MASVVVSANGALVHTGNHSRAAGRANRAGGKCVGETDTLAGKLVEIWSLYQWRAIAAQVGADVLGQNPQNIGPSTFAGRLLSAHTCRQGHRDCTGTDNLEKITSFHNMVSFR